MRTFVGDDEFVQPMRNETAPRSECRFTFKNALTQPRLLEMDVRPTINGVPTENDLAALGSVTLPTPALGTTAAFVDFDFSSLGIHISQGDVLAIVLSGDAQWSGNYRDLYPGGESFFRFPSDNFSLAFDGSVDVGFRTFVEPTPVPEPCTLALISATIFTTICYVKTAGWRAVGK